jgi:mannose-6-phosphate isomerase-like protein (cupin superfamily)
MMNATPSAALSVNPARQIVEELGTPDFSTEDGYKAYCHRACALYKERFGAGSPSPEFTAERTQVEGKAEALLFATPWGGVHVTLNDEATHRVEKYLIVDSGAFLAYEKHDEKLETLFHRSGTGILVYRAEGETSLRAAPVEPGFTITLKPGQEHCLISLDNLLVFESGTDPKGMDKDLIFIYQ